MKKNFFNKIIAYLGFQVLLILVSFQSIFSQQFNNWYFPINNGITFNTVPPSLISNSQINNQNNSCASISNSSGQILFYTNGINVWNRNNQLMPNGFGLKGQYCQVSGAMIIPFLNDTTKYYVFTSQGLTYYTGRPDTLRYSYSIIDMNLDNGLGDVAQKNVDIRGFAAQKMTAVRNANGTDIWWICRDWENHFYSYRITCNGFSNVPVVSTVGRNINQNQNPLIVGDIKASPDGKLIGACYYYPPVLSNYYSYTELYQFDNATGLLSNALRIPCHLPYGVEFSSSNKLIYISQRFDSSIIFLGPQIAQYNLSIFDSAAIRNSESVITPPYFVTGVEGGLQLGPDGKIYSNTIGRRIDRINQPDNLGVSCNFEDSVFILPNTSYRTLPYAAPFLFINQNVQIPSYTVASDCRTVTLTGKTYIRGNNLTFKWRFGDGDSAVQVVPSQGDTTYTTVTHTFPLGADTFNVQLFVTSDTVCGQGSAGKRISFTLARPTARFGYTAACGSTSVPFSDSSLANGVPARTYSWRFLDKNNVVLGTSALQNPTFSFPLYDTVRAMLIVSGGNGCTRPDTLVKTIVLKAKPVAAFTYANSCGSLSATFTNSSTIAAGSVQSSTWLLGDGNTSTLQSPVHTYGSFGTYTAKLVVTSTAGCTSDTALQTIIIKAKPVARMSYDSNTCASSPVLLRDSSFIVGSTLQSMYWAVPALNLSSNLPFIRPVFTTGGSYPVLHAITSAQGCTSDTISQNIFIESIPVAAITAPVTGCAGEAVTFTGNSTIAFGQIDSNRWQVGNNTPVNQSSTAAFTYSFPAAGSYTIGLQAISHHGCVSNTTTQTISIESKPVADFTNSLLCPGKVVQFTNSSTASSSTIRNSQWSINNAAPTTVSGAGNYSYTFSRGGTYTVQLTVTTAGGCSSTITKNVLVTTAIASAGNDTMVREGEPFTLQGSGGTSYLWQPSTGLDDATKDKPSGLLSNTQRYSVQVTTAQGCIGFDTVLVTILRQLKIANAFSPNGDGINDEWRIDELKDYPNAQLQLFDRYGQTVYTAKGNSITGWKGTAGGSNKPAPVGTYYYVITLNNELNKKPYTGWVMVVR